MSLDRSRRPGTALVALMVIVVITAAWWALAFWPAGTVEPDWLARTRGACFGSARGGLPDAGGWILLIGEPIGMLGFLGVVWGGSLREELRRVRGDWRWLAVGAFTTVLSVAGISAVAVRVARAEVAGAPVTLVPGIPVRVDEALPSARLTDQHERRVSLADLQGHATLITFAFGHCATVCPMVVHDLRAVRQAAARDDIRLVVITLDPWRDTPERLPTLMNEWGLARDDLVLSGTVAEVGRALDALRIVRRRNETTGDIDHVATALVIAPNGRITWRIEGGVMRLGEVLPVRKGIPSSRPVAREEPHHTVTGKDGPITSAEFVGRSTRARVQSGMTIGDADTFFFYLPPLAFHALYSSGIHLAQGR